MSKYRSDLPQLSNDLFLTGSGLETVLKIIGSKIIGSSLES